jgi:hypothetical protein
MMMFMDIASVVIVEAFIALPCLVMFAKIVPSGIEATGFALLSGNFELLKAISNGIGSLVNNLYVGVTKEN